MKHTIVYVDDDVNLLKTFKRLFSSEEYEVITFSDPGEALNIDTNTDIIVVISDFKMPGMNGIEFLQQFKIKFPKAIRILTTAFADVNATVSAINKGEVYRYINKPWKNDELRVLVKQAIQFHEMIDKNEELQKLTEKQLEELKEFNVSLEEKVKEKASELVEKNKAMESLVKKLDESFYESIRLVLKLLEIKEPHLGAHSKRVSLFAKLMAEELGMADDEKRIIELAGYLHDIGKIGFPEKIFLKNFENMNVEEKNTYMQHPVTGNLTLSYIPSLKEVADIVLSHHEDYSGTGFPAKLKGEDISVGARILRIVDVFDNLTNPYTTNATKFSMDDAFKKIDEDTIRIFDQGLTKSFKNVIESIKASSHGKKTLLQITPEQLKEGMLIVKDVRTQSGILIFKKDDVINTSMLQRMKEYVKIDPLKEKISVIAR